jgi:hypothetical protein
MTRSNQPRPLVRRLSRPVVASDPGGKAVERGARKVQKRGRVESSAFLLALQRS